MTLSEVNYSPLTDETSLHDQVIKSLTRGLIGRNVFIGIFIGVAVASLFVPYGLYLFISLCVPLAAYIARKTADLKTIKWQQFATVNGWRVSQADLSIVPPCLPHMYGSPKLSPVITAQYNNHTADLFSYQYTIGAGKSKKTLVFTIGRLQLSKHLPHILLNSHHNYYEILEGEGFTRYRLEGDFDRYFQLSFQKGDHVDALSVISPDVMQTLIDKSLAYDIEIFENSLYFIGIHDVRYMDGVPKLLQAIDALGEQIKHRAETYQDSEKPSIIRTAAEVSRDMISPRSRV